jgi:hypothetical protein
LRTPCCFCSRLRHLISRVKFCQLMAAGIVKNMYSLRSPRE